MSRLLREWRQLCIERLSEWMYDGGLRVRDLHLLVWQYFLCYGDMSEPVLFYQPRECTNHAPTIINVCCEKPKKWYRIDQNKPVAFRFIVPPRLQIRFQIKNNFTQGLGLTRPVFCAHALSLNVRLCQDASYLEADENDGLFHFLELDSRTNVGLPRERLTSVGAVDNTHLTLAMQSGTSAESNLLVAQKRVPKFLRRFSKSRRYFRRDEAILRSWKIYQSLFNVPAHMTLGIMMHVKKTTRGASVLYSLVQNHKNHRVDTSRVAEREAAEQEPIVTLDNWNSIL